MLDRNIAKKAAIIEIYSHHVFVNTLALILKNNNYKVSIFISKKIYDDVLPMFANNKGDFDWHVKGSNEGDISFLKNTKRIIEKDFDILFINSIQGHTVWKFYLVNFKIKTFVACGRISEWFGNKYSFYNKTFRKFIHHNYTHFLIQRMLPRYSGIIVHTDKAQKHAIKNNYNNRIIKLPYSLFKENRYPSHKISNKLKFCVTGGIREQSRDHMGTLKQFNKVWESGFKNFSLLILAYPRDEYGEQVINYSDKLINKGIDIKHFNNWISEGEYDYEAANSDIFISPIFYKEYYNCGELTSGIVESIRYAKPVIFPKGYSPESKIYSSSVFYENMSNLSSKIIELLSNSKLASKLKENAINNSKLYSLKSISDNFNIQKIDNSQ